jgi:hypothetical protein
MKMKRLWLLAFLWLPVAHLCAQTPEGYETGTIVKADGTKLQGSIKNNMRKKGEVQLLTASGEKQTFSADAVRSVIIGAVQFVAIGYEFFEVLATGSAMNLYRKASSAEGKLRYVGTEPVLISASEGRVGDYCVTTTASPQPTAISRKNFEETLLGLCASCATVTTGIRQKTLVYDQLKELVNQFNTCK